MSMNIETLTLTDRVIAAIAEELSWPLNRRPEITADSTFEDLHLSTIDLICATIAIEEAFGISLSDEEVEAWACVADVVRTLEGMGICAS